MNEWMNEWFILYFDYVLILNKFTFQQQVVASIEKERKKPKKKLSLRSVEEASDAGVEPLWDPNPVDRVTYDRYELFISFMCLNATILLIL